MARNDTPIREIADGELLTQLAERREELFNLRFQLVTGQLDNYSRLRQLKRDIARLHTELRAREIAAAEALENTQKEDAS